MSGKKEKKHFIVGVIMVAIIVAATATMIYCYINRFDPQEYVQAFLDVSYKQKTESYIKQTGNRFSKIILLIQWKNFRSM